MKSNSEPSLHQLREQQFIHHVEQLLRDDRLRIDTTRGRRPITTLIRDVSVHDRGVELKRLMSEMGKPDRQLEATMPVGRSIEVGLGLRQWWLFKSTVGRLRVTCISPTRALIAGDEPQPISAGEVAKVLSEIPPPLGKVPSTIVIMSTSGFTPDAKEAAERNKDRTVVLAWPNDAGGWAISGPPEMKALTDLFDPEGEADKRQRVRQEIEASRVDLLSGGIASDKIAARTHLALQLVESELKSYAKETPGMASKRLDGRVVLFREGSPTASGGALAGGLDMPFIERVKALFSGKGEIEKKVAFLSERRAALSQQRDQSYDDMGALEGKEAGLRTQFKESTGDISRRRITSQLVQLRKDIERRQQLLAVLNQQINVVSTHLHNLELQQQGHTANLPDSEEMASDAAAAEEVLAELEANSELADSVGSAGHSGMSDEEQALYEELSAEATAEKEIADADQKAKAGAQPARQVVPPPPIPQRPPLSQRQRNEPEAG